MWKKSKGFFFWLNICTVSAINDPGLWTGILLGESKCQLCRLSCEALQEPAGSSVSPGRPAEGLCAAPLFKKHHWRHLRCHFQPMSSTSAFPGPALPLRRAFQLMGSHAPISWHTKDNSKYSLSAAAAASVLMAIYHPRRELCFKSALAVNNAFIQADNVTTRSVNV